MMNGVTRCLLHPLSILCSDKRGVTAVEYGVIAALIVVVCITALQLVGGNLNTSFSTLASAVPR
jgi:pilus assembly protein Flp/PilA